MKALRAAFLAALLASSSAAVAQSTFPATVDRSSSVTLGGTSQAIAGANPTRRRIYVQNPCSTATQGVTAESLFVNIGANASTSDGKSIELGNCAIFDSGPGLAPQEAVNVTAATTNHKFIAKEW